MKEFRQLTVDDAAEYHEVLIAGYAENKNYPISFDAINFSPEESRMDLKISCIWSLCRWFFGMLYFIPHALDPKSYPIHIRYCHFVTSPEHRGRDYAREVLAETEDLLRNVYKTPAVDCARTPMAC